MAVDAIVSNINPHRLRDGAALPLMATEEAIRVLCDGALRYMHVVAGGAGH
jgi:hypothetical protein